jgi:hypothetical protein
LQQDFSDLADPDPEVQFTQLLIDCEDGTLRAVLLGTLREGCELLIDRSATDLAISIRRFLRDA